MVKKYLITLFCLCSVSQLFAFKVYNHRAITQRAVLALEKDSVTLSDKEKDWVLNGNEKEDSFISFQRLRNWHFYNESKRNKFSILLHRNSWKRYKRLSNRINRTVSYRRYYKTAGRMIHHIQDAVCPPHVVPVYHGRFDAFDTLQVRNYFSCDVTLNKNIDFENFKIDYLRETIDSTRERLAEKFQISQNGCEIEVSWNAFWQKPYQKKGTRYKQFGRYGFLGVNALKEYDNFMSQTISADGVIYTIPLVQYDELGQDQVQLALGRTAQMIFLFKNNPNKKKRVSKRERGEKEN